MAVPEDSMRPDVRMTEMRSGMHEHGDFRVEESMLPEHEAIFHEAVPVHKAIAINKAPVAIEASATVELLA